MVRNNHHKPFAPHSSLPSYNPHNFLNKTEAKTIKILAKHITVYSYTFLFSKTIKDIIKNKSE